MKKLNLQVRIYTFLNFILYKIKDRFLYFIEPRVSCDSLNKIKFKRAFSLQVYGTYASKLNGFLFVPDIECYDILSKKNIIKGLDGIIYKVIKDDSFKYFTAFKLEVL